MISLNEARELAEKTLSKNVFSIRSMSKKWP